MIKTVITLLIVICILASISSYLIAKFTNQQEIIHAKDELSKVHSLRDSLMNQIAIKDTLTKKLEVKTIELNDKILDLQTERNRLEIARRQAEANAFQLFRPDSIMRKMQEFWPEMAHSGWGFKEIYSEQYQVGIEYFLIPTQFTTTFIQDHIDAINYHAQRDTLLQIDDLRQVVVAYKDSIIQLEKEKASAYKLGYDDAYAKYEALNKKYIERLENPQIKLGLPSLSTILGSAAVGYVAGTLVEKKK